MTKRQGAIIGFGNIAEKGHWPSYAASPEAEIAAVMDPSEQRRAAARALKADMRTYATAEDLFRTEKVDFVDICTPPASHAPLILKALEHDAHVLCEKPLVLSEADYRTIRAEMKRRDRTVFAVHNWTYAPIIQKALTWIREGRIGRVSGVDLSVLRDTVCKGTDQASPGLRPPSPSGRGAGGEVSPENWRQDPSVSGGGILVDHGWHAFYLVMNLMGSDPQAVAAQMAFGAGAAETLEEVVDAQIQFPNGLGTLHLTWRAPERRNTIHVKARRGTLAIADDRLILSLPGAPAVEERFPALSAGSHHADWFQSLLPHFMAELTDPARRGENFHEAGWCLSLTRSSYVSNLQGFKPIPVDRPELL